jgi:four helix bundle protein
VGASVKKGLHTDFFLHTRTQTHTVSASSLEYNSPYSLLIELLILPPMFDFEKLDVYKKAKTFNKEVFKYLQVSKQLDGVTKNQFRRASFSIMLNIAEGTSRFSKADKKNFFVISRGSIFECVAILDFLQDEELIDKTLQLKFYQSAEELSKMLFSMIKNLEPAGKTS